MSKRYSENSRLPSSKRRRLFDDDEEDVTEDEVDENEVDKVEVDEDQEEAVSFLDNVANEIVEENEDALQNLSGDAVNFENWKNDRDIQEYLRHKMSEHLLDQLATSHEMNDDEKLSEWILEFDDEYDPDSMDVRDTYRLILDKHKEDLNIAIETAIEKFHGDEDEDESEN